MASRTQQKAKRLNAFDVLVVGDGIPSLVAALECARIGLRTCVYSSSTWMEWRDVAPARDGIVADLCAENDVSYATRECDREAIEIMGIPGSPLANATRKVIGWRGAWRAYGDRLKPLLTIGDDRNLAHLVRSRMGEAVLERLVRPAAREVWGCEPEEADVPTYIPGLSQAMSRVGSLSLGVLELSAADASQSRLISPLGGVKALETELTAKADYFAVSRITELPKGFSAHASIDLTDPLFIRVLDRGIVAARRKSQEIRSDILANADYRPIGPVDLEH